MNSTKTRINMRISEDNLALIREAAELSGQDLTSFVLSAALDRAREVSIETHITRLSRDEAQNLEQALSRDAAAKPALTELLTKALQQEFNPMQTPTKISR